MTVRSVSAVEELIAARPLRERKRARLRLTVLGALQERIRKTSFAQIPVRDLAAEAEVSEPTFFAHFPSKTDLLVYHVAIWRLRTTLVASSQPAGMPFLQAFFAETATAIRSGPQLWFEITAEIARGGGLYTNIELSPAERLLATGDARALNLDTPTQSELIARHLRTAVPPADLGSAVTALMAGFYGVPLALGPHRLDELPAAYDNLVVRCHPPHPRRERTDQ